MNRVKPYAAVVLGFWLAAVLQQSAAERFEIAGSEPNLLLTLAISIAVMYPPRFAAMAGFAAGLLYGGTAGADLAHYTIAYTIVAFFAGFVSRLELDVQPAYVALTVAAGSIVSGLLLLIPAPQPETWPYLRYTILSAMYNGVLAIPLYVLYRRFLQPEVNTHS